ncbi:C40 family peptidase [Flagellimonas sp. HMM57]|uniref:C40 family peptidase n=1 Tax=unclassified Flagellimonas TaxID=2644544 RepID=UPI0013D022CB|nr:MULTISPECIES: C40 family peptidase [unclassified Flagellimonas]UII74699.1 C40 family peptidase [Flagellimonas sp. HMM57]
MLQRALYLIIILLVFGCGTTKKKRTYRSTPKTISVEGSEEESIPIVKPKKEKRKYTKADSIIATAMTFSGTRYKYGGTTKKGMDCSGLLYVSLKENDIIFPRASHQMAEEGKRIKIPQVQKGDLLFFKTGKSGKRINHVGLVVDVEGDDIKFIHSTTSRGVIVSSLREGYWNYAFVKATRFL